MDCAIYARVSTEEQAKEGYSIAAQKDRLLSFAHSQDWDVVDFYVDEGQSAKDLNRPQMKRLLDDIEHGKIDVILVYKLDRLTRSVLDLYQLIQHFDKYGTAFKSATEVFDTTTPTGRLFITIVAALAQWERENLAERVRVGLMQKAKERKRPGGIIPYGYRKDGDSLVIDEAEAPIVRQIFNWYAAGDSMGKLVQKLAQMDIKTRAGVYWERFTLSYMLNNPVYMGSLRYFKKDVDKVLLADVFPAIIEKESFEQVQNAIKSRKKFHPRAATSDYVFSGILRCGRCGAHMNGRTNSYRTRRKYYACHNRISYKSCDLPLLQEEIIEKYFLQDIAKQFNELKKEAEQSASEVAASIDTESDKTWQIKSLQKQVKNIQQERKQMQRMRMKNQISDEELDEFLQENRSLEAELQQQLDDLTRMDTAEHTADDVIHALQDFEKQWSLQTEAEKKVTVSLLIKQMTVDTPDSTKGNQRIKNITISDMQFVD